MTTRESWISTLVIVMVLALALAIVGIVAPLADTISLMILRTVKETQ